LHKGTIIAQVLAVLATVALLICPTLTVAQSNGDIITAENVWLPKASMPTSRAGPGAAVVDGKIYAIGGEIRGGDVLGTNEEYDPAMNRWTAKASMPTNRSQIGIAVYENRIYCIGGCIYNFTSGKWEDTAVVEAYNPSTNTWETKASMPTARSRLQTNLALGKIYVMGGEPDQSLNYAYDPVTDSWVVKAPIPNVVTEGFNRAAIYASSAVIDDKIFWIGVISFTNSMNLANQMYDPLTDSWSQRAIPPGHLLPSAGAAITGEFAAKKIHVIGQNSQEHYAYDPAGDNWTKSTPLPDPRFEVGITVLNDTIYVIGGRYFYSTSSSVHQYIPTEYRGVIYDLPTPEPTQTIQPTPTDTPAQTATPSPQEPQPTATAAPTTASESSAVDAPTQTILITALIVGITIVGLAFVIWKRHQQTVEQRSRL
jgi:N-acetylneuraminic acid mutarotase